MPIYEYKCQHCGHQLEILQKITDMLVKTCPECHRDSLHRLVSAAAFKLKGSGWYATDFKDKKPKQDKQKDKADTKKTTVDTPTSDKGGNSDTAPADKSKKSSVEGSGSA